MQNLTSLVEQHLYHKGFDSRSRKVSGGEIHLLISSVALVEAVAVLKKHEDVILIGLWAAQDFSSDGFTLFYCFERRGIKDLFVLEVRLVGNKAISIASEYPIASYFQREVTDGFGIEFSGAFDHRRLFLHEIYPDDFHPLLKSFEGQRPEPSAITPEREYKFKEITGEGVYQIPVGPVHAGIIEPGHFRFSVIGEPIFNLEIRHFWKHRGIEKLAEGKTPDEVVKLAETISGDESAANACAFSMAVENIGGVMAPRRAWELRTIILELERIYSHLGDLAGMSVDVAYPVGAAPFFVLREEILRWNNELTGSRFLKGFIVPGGCIKDIPEESLRDLVEYTNYFLTRLEEAVNGVYDSAWVIDRFETTGVVQPSLISPLNLTGPIARASGANIDTRIDHPYGLYSEFKPKIEIGDAGDVLSRFQVKVGEVRESLRMVRDIIAGSMAGPVKVDCHPIEGHSLSLVEAARGQNLSWVCLKNGCIDRWKIRTSSFCNWLAIQHAVIGNIVPDFPLINKSMNLSYAGNDL